MHFPRRSGKVLFVAALLLPSSASASALPYRTAAEIRALSADQARLGHEIQVRGVVTNLSGWKNSFFFQDATAGISVDRLDTSPEVRPGDEVEIDGNSAPGLFAPIILSKRVRVIGHRSLPPAPLHTFEQLLGGRQDAQRIAVRGVVRSVAISESWGRNVLFVNLDLGAGSISARVYDFLTPPPASLVDAEVTVQGVCGTNFNDKRQYVGLRLFVNDLSDVRIERPPPKDPFAIPAEPIASVLQFSTMRVPRHRVRIEGVVTYQRPGRLLCVQSGNDGIYVETDQPTRVAPGTRVEVVGFGSPGQYSPMLQSALFRVIGPAPQPAVAVVEASKVIQKGANLFPSAPYDGLLIRVRGRLIQTVQGTDSDMLVLRDQGIVFRAWLNKNGETDGPKPFANGSLLDITGVCIVRTDESRQPRTYSVEMRSPADIVLVAAPPWWNLRHALQALAIAALLILIAVAWAGMLHRRVKAQTRVIHEAHEQLRVALEKAQEMARLDFLTGLKNRRAFYELGETEVLRARRYGRPLSLAYIDLDNFKAINDNLGHEEGDRLLVTVAGIIREQLRATDIIARLGGDEFAVLLPETGEAAARNVLEKLRAALLRAAQDRLWPVTFSIGTVVCEQPPPHFENLVRDADQVMYAVKRKGKDSLTLEVRASL